MKTLKAGADRFDLKDLTSELIMMKKVGQHPNVVSLLGACSIGEPLYIIIEYISGGNLLDYLRASRRSNDLYVNVVSTLTSRSVEHLGNLCNVSREVLGNYQVEICKLL